MRRLIFVRAVSAPYDDLHSYLFAFCISVCVLVFGNSAVALFLSKINQHGIGDKLRDDKQDLRGIGTGFSVLLRKRWVYHPLKLPYLIFVNLICSSTSLRGHWISPYFRTSPDIHWPSQQGLMINLAHGNGCMITYERARRILRFHRGSAECVGIASARFPTELGVVVFPFLWVLL